MFLLEACLPYRRMHYLGCIVSQTGSMHLGVIRSTLNNNLSMLGVNILLVKNAVLSWHKTIGKCVKIVYLIFKMVLKNQKGNETFNFRSMKMLWSAQNDCFFLIFFQLLNQKI